jgi:hypothetical protein
MPPARDDRACTETVCGRHPAVRRPPSVLLARISQTRGGCLGEAGAPGTSVKFHKDALSPTFGPRFSTVAIAAYASSCGVFEHCPPPSRHTVATPGVYFTRGACICARQS